MRVSKYRTIGWSLFVAFMLTATGCGPKSALKFGNVPDCVEGDHRGICYEGSDGNGPGDLGNDSSADDSTGSANTGSSSSDGGQTSSNDSGSSSSTGGNSDDQSDEQGDEGDGGGYNTSIDGPE